MRRLSVYRVWLLVIMGAFGLSISLVPPAAAVDDQPEAAEPSSDSVDRIDFVKDVQPLLRQRCFSCHGAEESESGLRLDQQKRAFEGGDNGRMIVPGKPLESRLLRIVAGQDDEIGAMPPEGEGTPLSAGEIAILRAWIAQGAVWPIEADSADRTSHWSFQPIKRPPPPTVKDMTWGNSTIDAFIMKRLEAEGISPSPPAPRAARGGDGRGRREGVSWASFRGTRWLPRGRQSGLDAMGVYYGSNLLLDPYFDTDSEFATYFQRPAIPGPQQGGP